MIELDDESNGSNGNDKLHDFKIARETVIRTCGSEIEDILRKYGCQLIGVPVFIPDSGTWKLSTRVEIILNG